MFPKTFQDKAAFVFLITCIISVFAFEVLFVLPAIGCPLFCPLWFFQTCCGLFIMLNILSNLFAMMGHNSSTAKLMLPSEMAPDWRFCSVCEANAPPRSFHCLVCGWCVLRRDHHCTFSGCCVGYANVRFFFALLFHMFVGSLYASALNARFVWGILGTDVSLQTAITYLFPLVFWALGYLGSRAALCAFLSLVSSLGGLFAAVLLCAHGSRLVKNQTCFESYHHINKYNLGSWKRNIVATLGHNWHLIWISPTVPSSPLGDGLSYPTVEEYKLSSEKMK